MIRINLLPREDAPKQRNITLPDFSSFAPLVLVVAAIGVMAVLALYQGQKIADLEQTIAAEEAESRRLAPEIAKIKRLDEQRQSLNQRLEVISTLDRDRYFRVHLLDELNRALPEHLWVTAFTDAGGGAYALEGVTFSNFLVSDLLQNLDQSPYFDGVSLVIAEKGEIEDVSVVKFKINVRGVRPAGDVAFGG
ncbi:MAG TPA: PilN domain-containing protein [Candidatus Krumholzibacteria bacterium]|nr:PilN domain-containing protein [Candidatus Krumholzibacteria bacterium]HPD71465.1 PilN domain-containing protein [Candidatus Krumholzibacteria bacterium]HRY41602.1 PilN domain-containing protein [Candidatus Krumholzibacteria bacterium]